MSHSHITLDERLPGSLLSFLTRLPPVHLQLECALVAKASAAPPRLEQDASQGYANHNDDQHHQG